LSGWYSKRALEVLHQPPVAVHERLADRVAEEQQAAARAPVLDEDRGDVVAGRHEVERGRERGGGGRRRQRRLQADELNAQQAEQRLALGR
jgi:hypothetical protein